ncbi:hypothetical protein FACS189475_07830 [Betaproteobacteria bacterium]|nr:hypothetical protein FACS189475_07830 [Betaproteobacteria bacterium]
MAADVTINSAVTGPVCGNGTAFDCNNLNTGPAGLQGNTVKIIDPDGAVTGDVYGALNDDNANTVTGNSVTIDRTGVSGATIVDGAVYGGASKTSGTGGEATGNEVTVTDSVVNGNVYGSYAFSDSATASGSVDISGSVTSVGDVYGGLAWSINGAATATGIGIGNVNVRVSDATANNVTGGYAQSNSSNPGDMAGATGNMVEISGATVINKVTGGEAWSSSGATTATATGNAVTVTDSTVNGIVYGSVAYGVDADATASGSVDISGSVTSVGDVYGGYAKSNNGAATATTGNVSVSGVSVGSFFGGLAWSDSGDATATGNSVEISDATVGYVTGSLAIGDSATASGSVKISGATMVDSVTGGHAESSSGAATATGNTVTLDGSAYVVSAWGGYGDGDAYSDFFTDNTLNKNSEGSRIGGVNNFEYVNFDYTGAANIAKLDLSNEQSKTVKLDVSDTHNITFGSANQSNNPPAKPGAFICEPLKAARRGSLTRPRILHHLMVVTPLHQIELIQPLILLFLLPDVAPNHLFVTSYRGNEIPSRPKMLPDEITFALPEYARNMDCTLALDVPDHLRHCVLWRYRNQHMNMVDHQVSFQNHALFA